MDQNIIDFIACKRIAVVGVSRSDKKFGNSVYKELKERGYQVFAVNPAMQKIGEEPCYPDLLSLKGKVDAVVVVVPPTQGVEVVRQAVEAGIKHVWIQQMAGSPEISQAAKSLGLNLVDGKCILMYAEPVGSFHGWHRGFMRLIGRL